MLGGKTGSAFGQEIGACMGEEGALGIWERKRDPWGSLEEELDYIFLASVGRGVGVGVGKRR